MAIEEQLAYNLYQPIDIAFFTALGQRLTIPNRIVTKLGFWLMRIQPGGIAGDVYFEINRVSDDSLIVSKEWGRLADVPDIATYLEVTFDTPTLINEEVRVYIRVTWGTAANHIGLWIQNADVKAGEAYSRYRVLGAAWEMLAGFDCAYRYTYNTTTVQTLPATEIK